jgi:YHS domain-containing protein
LLQVDAIDKSGLAIGGYDLVSYHKTISNERIRRKHKIDGTTYYFAKENAMAFKANPKKYLPEVNGCAWGVAERF